MYDYRLEGHLKEAIFNGDIFTLQKILRSHLLPKPRIYYYYHLCVQNGQIEPVRAFLSNRLVHIDHVNRDYGENSRVTALHEAILHCKPSMVKFLLCCGASIETEATFSFCHATSMELARKVNNETILKILTNYKKWFCEKLTDSVNYLTNTKNYVLSHEGRNINSGLAKSRLETVDELIDFFKIVRSHISILQNHWKILESIFERKAILVLIDQSIQSIQVLIKYHKLTEMELRIYESRLKTKVA